MRPSRGMGAIEKSKMPKGMAVRNKMSFAKKGGSIASKKMKKK